MIPDQKLDNLSVEFLEGKTNPPTLLKESDLIQLMDSNEIGTDATIHEHIKKIQDRQYAIKKNGFFEPTPIGISLIHSYNQMNLKIAEPQLRANMEKQLKLVAEGKENKDKVLSENIQEYQEIMNSIKQQEENFGDLFLQKYNEIIENTKKRKYTRKVIKNK